VDNKTGDKIRVIAGPHTGSRALVASVRANTVLARLASSDKTIALHPDEITNFSAAARKAWKTMPSRRVGRPAGKGPARTSVTLRIDKELWSKFQDYEARGLIQDRSQLIEQLLTKKFELIDRSDK
jgi:uncharacterized protein (DUF4415 family)